MDNTQFLLYPPASRGRLFLAVYIDFCFLSVIAGFVHAVLPDSLGKTLNNQVVILLPFVLTFIFEWLLIRVLKIRTVGQQMLSIFMNPREGITLSDPQFFLVSTDIKERENWVTMFIGIYLINEGCKDIFRWVANHTFPPLFGVDIPEPWSIIAMIGLGIAGVVLGEGILKLKRTAMYGALVYFLVITFGFMVGHQHIVDWIQAQIFVRESLQDRAASNQEMARMAQMLVVVMEYTGVILAAMLYYNQRRFKD